MNKTWIGFLIVLSIALQSFIAVANSESDHQPDAQHLQTEHSHEIDYVEIDEESSVSEHNIKDCHHCGHCQGSHTQWFSTKKVNHITAKLLIPNQYFYLVHLDNSFIEQLIRPPIA
ncbi:MAG: DUF2946 domain-containing protein [Colwellia sp.]|nr:DUF2946 domain-containing protein [Colwellia sp.]